MEGDEYNPKLKPIELIAGLGAGIGTGALAHIALDQLTASAPAVSVPGIITIVTSGFLGSLSFVGTALTTAEMNISPSLRSDNKRIRMGEYVAAGIVGSVLSALTGTATYFGLAAIHHTPDVVNVVTAAGLASIQGVGMVKGIHPQLMQFRKNIMQML